MLSNKIVVACRIEIVYSSSAAYASCFFLSLLAKDSVPFNWSPPISVRYVHFISFPSTLSLISNLCPNNFIFPPTHSLIIAASTVRTVTH